MPLKRDQFHLIYVKATRTNNYLLDVQTGEMNPTFPQWLNLGENKIKPLTPKYSPNLKI